ncbi:hypothetical protein E4U21_005881 [Claviceps maximensis]|nr:hypothetical protein E4U21_005881 [Claviceps maximensis]
MQGYPSTHLVGFGPDANCTLSTCPVSMSVYKYRPSLPANAVFMALFAAAMSMHVVLGIRWRQWGFMSCILVGCVVELAGYGSRLVMYGNPFSYMGFILQICFITTGPVFYTAAIYITLSKIINHLSPNLSRVNPKFFSWIFIGSDIVCLALQSAGGAISTQTGSESDRGINMTIVGLVMQVVVIGAYMGVLADYMIRYVRSPMSPTLTTRTRVFISFLSLAIVLILGRSIYRAYELSRGYHNSELIQNEVLFIVLEGVLIVMSVFALCIGHPGMLGSRAEGVVRVLSSSDADADADVEKLDGIHWGR